MNTDKQRVIKFRYYYSNGQNFRSYDFTLDEISNGEPFEVLSNSPFVGSKNYKHVGTCQFTGLHDKAGKEIYEGDIDSHGRHIKYRDGAFHVVQSNGQTFDYLCHMKHIEIIGHIYSPEK